LRCDGWFSKAPAALPTQFAGPLVPDSCTVITVVARIRLRLFGEVGWSIDDYFSPIRGATRLGLILSLAEARGAAVSVDGLLARLWHETPRSGANAVQRHVSALRSQLHDLGVAQPSNLIESTAGGYRLCETTTDLGLLHELIRNASSDPGEVRWWEEPLVGAPWDSAQPLRAQLTHLAGHALRIWSDSLPPERVDEAASRAELVLAHSPGSVAALDVQHDAQRRIRKVRSDLLSPSGVQALRNVSGLWAHGLGTEALDALEAASGELPPDLTRRLMRSLIWLDPNEPWAHNAISALVLAALSNPVQHERAVVTIDARALEETVDGIATAKNEVDAATTEWERIRALRVQFMLTLSSPYVPSHGAIVEQLHTIDHPDAQVEAQRFRFISELRLGNVVAARATLATYADTVSRCWPGTGDDFAPMARAILQRSIDPRASTAFGPELPHLAGCFTADPWALPLAEGIRRLIRNDPREPLSDTVYHLALSAVSRTAHHAMELLRDLNSGRPVEVRAHELADQVLVVRREKQFMMLPIALCLVAEALRDRALAQTASIAMKPWAGQTLGLWPVDFFFGPADDWLERLAAV